MDVAEMRPSSPYVPIDASLRRLTPTDRTYDLSDHSQAATPRPYNKPRRAVNSVELGHRHHNLRQA